MSGKRNQSKKNKTKKSRYKKQTPKKTSNLSPVKEESKEVKDFKPEILGPAGNMESALAALAAGADALYLGLKHFSARMEAENFNIKELSQLTDLARKENKKVYVTLNTLIKPHELDASYRLIKRLMAGPKPHALIIQDPGMISLAQDAGFEGELHLSTLANITHQAGLKSALKAGAKRVVLPREISLDEVKLMNEECPDGLDLELFIHGALCYCISGRCWWSSYMGGKSGLRGRCVQPCRRVYKQRNRQDRYFSCLDLDLTSAAGPLLNLPKVKSWKIEGRKKSPHYVYHVVKAYKLLRDDPSSREEAEALLKKALGRPGTGAHFFSLKADSPNSPSGNRLETGSGFLVGRVQEKDKDNFSISPSIDLLSRDLLRVGHEDEKWHSLVSVHKPSPASKNFLLRLPRNKNPKNGTPVYLIDRKDPELEALIKSWKNRLDAKLEAKVNNKAINKMTAPNYSRDKGTAKSRSLNIIVRSYVPTGKDAKADIKPGTVQGLWLTPRSAKTLSQTVFSRISWWLPPAIWPQEELRWKKLVGQAVRKGARHFVCNAPWQVALFKNTRNLSLTAGPFCNIANAASIKKIEDMGFSHVIISPELGEKDILNLPSQSSLPLGIVLEGWWPMGISRHGTGGINEQFSFVSPMKEEFWVRRYGENIWIYPTWPLDLTKRFKSLEQAGYKTFIQLNEHLPRKVKEHKRESEFNWDVDLL